FRVPGLGFDWRAALAPAEREEHIGTLEVEPGLVVARDRHGFLDVEARHDQVQLIVLELKSARVFLVRNPFQRSSLIEVNFDVAWLLFLDVDAYRPFADNVHGFLEAVQEQTKLVDVYGIALVLMGAVGQADELAVAVDDRTAAAARKDRRFQLQ